MKTPVWLILLLVAFALGVLVGQRPDAALQAEAVVEPIAAPVEPISNADPGPQVRVAGYHEAVAARDWDALVALLEAASFEDRDADHAELYAAMRWLGEQLADAGAIDDVRALLGGFAELNPQDHDVRFQLAEALEESQQYMEALLPTLEVLQAPLTAEIRERAQALRDALIMQESERLLLVSEDGVAAAELVALYEQLVAWEPVNDAHRAALAEAYLALGEADQAEQTLAQIAGYGVPAADIEALRAAIALARTGVQLRSEDRGLYASAMAAGQPLNLLLDTGASQTALTPGALAQINATPLGRSVNVRTAGGLVVAPVYQVREFQFGGSRFPDLEVLALRSLPRGADGLLGMDVLNEVGQVAIQQ